MRPACKCKKMALGSTKVAPVLFSWGDLCCAWGHEPCPAHKLYSAAKPTIHSSPHQNCGNGSISVSGNMLKVAASTLLRLAWRAPAHAAKCRALCVQSFGADDMEPGMTPQHHEAGETLFSLFDISGRGSFGAEDLQVCSVAGPFAQLCISISAGSCRALE